MTTAILFPGQGSQSPGMQADLAGRFPLVNDVYAEASEVLGYDLWALVQSAPAEKLAETTVTQPAMLAAGVAAWRCWVDAGGDAGQLMSGHSLGEYSALVCADAIDFADAMRVVKRRSELMQAAVPVGQGAMAAILGLDDDVVEAVCDEAGQGGVVEPVNYNSPGQVVVAGAADAVAAAVELAKSRGARRAILLPVSVPSHSSMMREAGVALSESLQAAAFRTPAVTVIGAATAKPYTDADDIRTTLSSQVYRPVRWTATIAALAAGGANTFVECGPGKVLAGLVRRIDKSLTVATIDGVDGLDKALAA